MEMVHFYALPQTTLYSTARWQFLSLEFKITSISVWEISGKMNRQRKFIHLASLFAGRNNTELYWCMYSALYTIYYLDQQMNNILVLTVIPIS